MNDRQNSLSDTTPGEYHSYLLRILRPNPQGGWRIMVKSVVNGEQHTFADLAQLCAFLADQLTSSQLPPPSQER